MNNMCTCLRITFGSLVILVKFETYAVTPREINSTSTQRSCVNILFPLSGGFSSGELVLSLQADHRARKVSLVRCLCSARDWERSGLLEENPQSGCTEIHASLKGPL